ncbi:spermidine synthase [Candidatus Omnitrophota bacterium]
MTVRKKWWLDIIVFLSAFLLFQVELIVAKLLLPKFGGGYSVWGAALVFFQGTLLLGYLYAHVVIQRFGIARYRRFHIGLLLFTLLFFPGRSLAPFFPHYHIPLVFDILRQLLTTIGMVFFVLSTTSIIFQSWLAESNLKERHNPYTLYAVSNLGSFAALLTYPFIFEAFFGLTTQVIAWRIVYFVLIGLHIIAFRLIKVSSSSTDTHQSTQTVRFQEKLRWGILGAAGVIMFLSVTNIITYEITPMPLLWILPLCIYLISFVLNFKEKPWCPSWIVERFDVMMGLSIFLFYLTSRKYLIPFPMLLTLHGIMLFIICMFCQHLLHKYKPRDSKILTTFYLCISIGGFLGSVLVSWCAPLLFTSMVEYLVGLFLITVAMVVAQEKLTIDHEKIHLCIFNALLMFLWPVVFQLYNVFGMVFIIVLLWVLYGRFKGMPLALCLCVLLMLLGSGLFEFIWEGAYEYKYRNNYGIHKVFVAQGLRRLAHGVTNHGAQFIDKDKAMQPVGYYHKSAPMGKLIASGKFDFKKVAVIGLGTGGIAAYGQEGREIDFYELDRDVFRIANERFTFLKNSPSAIHFIFGDGRLSLRENAEKKYDLLIIDAFSGDSVPTHLLTLEAIKEGEARITENGIMLFHISNVFIDLVPILAKAAEVLDLYACGSYLHLKKPADVFSSTWLILTPDANTYGILTSELGWQEISPKRTAQCTRPWTDDYVNFLPVFKISAFLSSLKHFKPFYWGRLKGDGPSIYDDQNDINF